MTAIAAIHTARRQLGLDDDAARDLYQRETGKRSLREMSSGEHLQVLRAMRASGFKPAQKGLQGPFAKKLQALWIAAWNLGIVRDKTDAALLSFVRRQTQIDHTRFLIDAAEAAKAIDALKAWMTREAHVDWSVAVIETPQWARHPAAKIALAQWSIATKNSELEQGYEAFRRFVAEHARPLGHMEPADWPTIMNVLGARIRKAKGDAV